MDEKRPLSIERVIAWTTVGVGVAAIVFFFWFLNSNSTESKSVADAPLWSPYDEFWGQSSNGLGATAAARLIVAPRLHGYELMMAPYAIRTARSRFVGNAP